MTAHTLKTALRTSRIAKACALAVGFGLLSTQAFAAGDAALYGPTAPKGSAFVRVYNASGQQVSSTIGNNKPADVPAGKGTAFEFMPGGQYTAKLGSESLPVNVAGDHYYTIVKTASGTSKLVEEGAFTNKQKALVRVQNLSDKPLALKTADGKEVIPAVAPNGHGEREINPVKVSLALFDGANKVADLKPVNLERGKATVLFVTGQGTSLNPAWVEQTDSAR
ncbi:MULTISPECIES: alginate O-acetyltransferase AlgF [Pseudomonas]|uniref:Alginate biosynthesis protein AlgF n=1 Tax=Pseudomonas quercus TaxID=2722792 RepID=A0ABX0YAM1_9PSED|nr:MULTISPECIES: alginate O-acetyltransferase AlgF [Pseudomonas]MBF7141851.1 alginate O-acetyltransferase AlgF [Pseudomonas sp. LY10J]NJP00390.1 alginate O-acetyltransferase [Pseudomonas quercus]